MTNLTDYSTFVYDKTSQPSKNLEAWVDRLYELEKSSDVNFALLTTGAAGLNSEAGELIEIIKKIHWQGKPLTDDTITHMQKELGDILFYWTQTCLALNIDSHDIIQQNIDKLTKRYPEGFSVDRSENRAEGDI